ncbi:hypothetical protein ACO0RG_001079 [Hanseniaspora osmophila]
MSKKDANFATDSQVPFENASGKQNATKNSGQNKNLDVENIQGGDSNSAIMSGNEDHDTFDVSKHFSDDRRDSTDVFLKPRQDSMSLYTNFMPRLSNATESSIANYLNMDSNNNNRGTTPDVHRGYSIVNNNMFAPGPSGSARSSSSRRQSVVQGTSGAVGSALNSNIAQQNTFNGARRPSEQLEPFVPPMKFKTPNFGSSSTGTGNYTTNNTALKRSNSGTRGSKTKHKSATPVSSFGTQDSNRRGAAANILSNNNNNNSSSDNLGSTGLTADSSVNQNAALTGEDIISNQISKTNVPATPNNNNQSNKNHENRATTKNESMTHSSNTSPNLHSQLPELPALRSDSISSILGAAAMINQPLQPPSKRNSIFMPTDQLTSNTTQNNEHGTMKPPSTTAPTYYNKQQQHQQQQFQQLLNSNSLGNLYSDANNGGNHITDNIDFDIFSNLNTSRKSSFRFGDDFDLSAFRRRDSSVRGTLDLPPLPGSSISNRLRAGSRTFSQNFNHHPFSATSGPNNTNATPNTITGNGKKEEQEHFKNSRYSNFLKNNENAISDYEDDDLIDLHGLTRATSIGAGNGAHVHSNSNQLHNNNQGLMDSRMIMRRKSNLRDNSMTPIPLTTPPLTGFGHAALPNINNSSAVSDPLLGLDSSSHMDVPPSLTFDANGNIVPEEIAPAQKSSSKKSSSKKSSSKKSSTKTSSSKSSSSKSSSTKKDSSQKSRKRKSSSNTETGTGADGKESKPKKRKTSKKTSSSSSTSSGHKNDHPETSSKSTDEKSGSKKSSRSKKDSKSKSSKKSKKGSSTTSSSTASDKSDATKPSTKKKRSSTSSSSKPTKKVKSRGSALSNKVPESLISHPIIVENPMKNTNGTTDKNDNPVLGATRVDQLMLILQARQKGFTTALETTKDGKINIDNAPEIIPPAIELVGGVDKPKTHDLLLNPMSHSPSITTEALLNSVGGVKPDPDGVLMTPSSTLAVPAFATQKSPSQAAKSPNQTETSLSKMASPQNGKGTSAIGTPLMQSAATIASPLEKSELDTAQAVPAVSTPSTNSAIGVAGTPNGAGSPVSATGSASGSVSGKRKLHVCQYCHKHFTQSTHLEVHVRSHIGLKPYECSYCGKTFTQGGNLRTHIRLHTGEQPFQCNVCGKKFSRKGNLQAHSLTHENFRPFQCILDGCDKSFTQLGNLKSHQNKFHLDTLNVLTMKLALNNFDLENEEERRLLEYLSSLYKNSNKGIKGRGKNSASAQKSNPGTPSQKPGSPSLTDSLGTTAVPVSALPVAPTEVQKQKNEPMLDEAAVAALTNSSDV